MTVMARWRTRRRRIATTTVAALLTVTAAGVAQIATSSAAEAATPSAASPTVTGPVTGGKGVPVLGATAFDLGKVGYRQSEYFLAGSATAYQASGTLGSDGKWTVTPAATAPYTTRIVVNRPVDAKKFNGTVVVEWLNVSAGYDGAPDWTAAHNQLIRDGYAWVGVSAQAVGLNATKNADPDRYQALSHPGDSYSYDIFSQVGQAVRKSAGTVLGGLAPKKVLGDGESQSAFRLTTYVNAIHPLVNVYDGYLLHSRAGTASALSQAPERPDIAAPAVVRIRPDLAVPVLTFQTETDLPTGLLGYVDARQDDTNRFRLWEVAGTAHADAYTIGIGATDVGDGQGSVAAFNALRNPPTGAAGFSCAKPINAGEQQYVLQAAFSQLNRWVTTGQAPSKAPRLQIANNAYVLDANGNVKGGIRTPRGRRSGGEALRARSGHRFLPVLRPVRHHRPVHPGAAARPVPVARRLRRRLDEGYDQRRERRLHPAGRREAARGGGGVIHRARVTVVPA